MEFTPVVDETLFSTIVTVYILGILYSPAILWRALFSPVLLITATLLLFLLRSGAGKSNPEKEVPTQVIVDDPSPAKNRFEEAFVEWDVKAPLEVIYEGDEELDSEYLSLSMCFPETDHDSGSSTDGDFPVVGDWISDHDFSFEWCSESELNQNHDGLIEIALKPYGDEEMIDNIEEDDNLIEIDIFPATRKENLDLKLGDSR